MYASVLEAEDGDDERSDVEDDMCSAMNKRTHSIVREHILYIDVEDDICSAMQGSREEGAEEMGGKGAGGKEGG